MSVQEALQNSSGDQLDDASYGSGDGILRTPPCISNTSSNSGEMLEGSPPTEAIQDKTVADLANELSPIPSNEPYMAAAQRQELMAFMPKYENDSDDETLRAQSGDESSDSRNASESEADDTYVDGSSHAKVPVKNIIETGKGNNVTCGVQCVTRTSGNADNDNKDARAWVS